MNAKQLQAHVKSGKNITYPGMDDWERIHCSVRLPADALVCKDGFRVSVQASATHYCTPRDNEGPYSTFELGYPSQADDLISAYAEDSENLTGTVYAQIPLQTVLTLIKQHGGLMK